jgi:hypothetical protein
VTGRIHDRGDIANVDIYDFEPPDIISKPDESTSPTKFIENPMLKSKAEDYQSFQD